MAAIDKYKMTGTKLLWHMDRVNAWKNGERVAPIHISLGIANYCNSKCKFCYGTFFGKDNKNKKYMSLDTIKNLLDDCQEIGVKSIVIMGEGENTISPHFYDMLEYSKNNSVDLSLATNLIDIKEDKIELMLQTLQWIRISICGSNRDIYKTIHQVDKYDQVIDNIKKLVKIKKENGYNTTIGLQVVVIEDNFDDLVNIAKLGKELGVDYCVMKPCSDTNDGKLNINVSRYKDVHEILKDAESENNDNYDVIVKWNKFNYRETTFKNCYGTVFSIGIDALGNVGPCGHLLGYKKEYFNMGNMNNNRFKDIVKSNKYWTVQNRVHKLNVRKECETYCLHCYMNQFLEEYLHPPEHINYV